MQAEVTLTNKDTIMSGELSNFTSFISNLEPISTLLGVVGPVMGVLTWLYARLRRKVNIVERERDFWKSEYGALAERNEKVLCERNAFTLRLTDYCLEQAERERRSGNEKKLLY